MMKPNPLAVAFWTSVAMIILILCGIWAFGGVSDKIFTDRVLIGTSSNGLTGLNASQISKKFLYPNEIVISNEIEKDWHPTIRKGKNLIIFTEVKEKEEIEWKTVSTTIPAPCGISGCLVLHRSTDNQIGTKYKIYYLEIEWKGIKREVRLDSEKIETKEPLNRSIPQSSSGLRGMIITEDTNFSNP